jgi:hypothetical protein
MSEPAAETSTGAGESTGADATDPNQYDSPDEAPQELLDEIEQEREERLDSDNRPDGVEVDNTDRDFDVEHGRFEDTEVDEELGPFNTADEA